MSAVVIGCARITAQDDAPAVVSRTKPVLTDGSGRRFKDLNANGRLDQYEDWRLPAAARAADLVQHMTFEEKAGMMLIDTLNAPVPPDTIASTNAARFINDEKMTRFVFRSRVRTSGSFNVTPRQAAEFTNAVQAMAEATRLGIPVLFKSNTRNHYERQARDGINEPAGSFSEWPKEAGLAATRDMGLVERFANTMGMEWRAIGLRGVYGYMGDLATEPRWFRVHETFTEDADLATRILPVLVRGLQGRAVSPRSNVVLTVKHFPGGGPQEAGLDPHYTFGKNQTYPANRLADHLRPFAAAIEAGVPAVMPYYGVPVNAEYPGIRFEGMGMAFSKPILSDLLRGRLGFNGYINSDTGIIEQRAWGLEAKTVPERVSTAINAGIDLVSGFNRKQTLVDLVKAGLVSEGRVDDAVNRLLIEQFKLGLFEDPYVDAALADGIVGKEEFRQRAVDAQRASIVLLKNQNGVLPLRPGVPGRPTRLYTLGLNTTAVQARYPAYVFTHGDQSSGTPRVPVPRGTDYVVVRVEVSNPLSTTSGYRSADASSGGRLNPATGRAWGADDPGGIDDGLRFGGALPWEVDLLSFSEMASAKSWEISPPLHDIQSVMNEIGDSRRVVLCIYFRQPYVLDAGSRLMEAGGLLATFGVSDEALMDVLTGRFKPRGRLPFALARTADAIRRQDPDAPGYPGPDTLYPFGFGLSY